MPRLTKADVGQYLAIRFIDHAIQTGAAIDDPIEIEAIGMLTAVNAKRIVLSSWVPITADPAMRHSNSERSVIVQSCITKIVRLEPKQEA